MDASSPVDTFQAIVLGVVQGLTEFLPVSSTAHLRIVPAVLGWEDPGAAFTAISQFGTLAAVLIYFRADLLHMAGAWFRGLRDPVVRRSHDSRMGWYLIFATIPISIVGLIFSDTIENGARNLQLIGSVMIILGLVLSYADHVGKKERTVEDVHWRDALVVGSAQTLALIPGVSRSGSTITAGLFMGLERAAAARFSFLLSIPAVVLSGAYELLKVVDGTTPQNVGALQLVIATGLAFIIGYAAIAGLIRYLQTRSAMVFVVYRVIVGSLVLGLSLSGQIH